MDNFEPLRYDNGQTKTMLTANSASISKGDPLEINSSGYVTAATSSTSAGDVSFVAMEDKETAADEHDELLCLHVDGVEFKVKEDSGSLSQSDVGTKCKLSDDNKMDVSSSSTTIFHLTEVVDSGDGVGKGYFIIS